MTATTLQQKRRTAPKEERRRQLIEATIDSIAEFGLSGTTMASVTSRAHLSIGTVNFHFKSKDILFTETLLYLAYEHQEKWMKHLADVHATPADKLLSLVDAHFHVDICNRRKLTVWFAFFGEARYRAQYCDKIAGIDNKRRVTTETLLAEIIREGGYGATDPAVISKNLEGLYDGLWLNMLMYPDRYTPKGGREQIYGYLAAVFPQHFPKPPL